MDHKMAENQMLADKYTLNELSTDERAQFEEHLFDCPICADEVRQTFTVVENLKEVLREEKAMTIQSASVPRAAWRDWLRLPSLVPTFAAFALAGVMVYQYSTAGVADMAQVLVAGAVIAPVSRGAKEIVRVNPASSVFLVSFSVDAPKPDAFICEFQNASGAKILTLQSPRQNTASFNLPVVLPAKDFPAGDYRMVLRPASEPDSITTYPFAVSPAMDDSK